jgi:alpha-tubulin suppressor-like RCC1 family protein
LSRRSPMLPLRMARTGLRALWIVSLVVLLWGSPGCSDSPDRTEDEKQPAADPQPLLTGWHQPGMDPRPVPGGEWLSVHADFQYTCAIRLDGSLRCWGRHRSGRLGDAAAVDRDSPVAAGSAADWKAVALADFLTCGLRGAGSELDLWCWGSQDNGKVSQQYPRPTSVSPERERVVSRSWLGVPRDLKPADVAIGDAHTCLLTEDGRIYCAGGGPDRMGAPTCPPFAGDWCPVDVSKVIPASPFMSLAVGSKHSLAVTRDGILYGWGGNHRGQVGTGVSGGDVRMAVPVDVGLLPDSPTVQQVAAGTHHACAIFSGGMLACWGSNDGGCLGVGDVADRNRPTPVSMTGALSGTQILQVDAGFDFTCALSADGDVICWGLNYCSDPVQGKMERTACGPIIVAGPTVGHPAPFRQVSCGCSHACAVNARNEIYCWGAGEGPWLGRGPVTHEAGLP